MEQWQPVLLAGIARARADGRIERIAIGRRSEDLDVPLPETLLGLLPESQFAHRHQNDFGDSLLRSLRFRIETLNAFERVAKKIQPQGCLPARWKKIQNATAHCEFARLHDGSGALIARHRKSRSQAVHVGPLTGCQRLHRMPHEGARGQALHNGVCRRQKYSWVLARRRQNETR